MDIPHFTIPFNIAGDHFAENEQDSLEDVVAGVKSVILTEPGQRQMLPEFGMTDPTFTIQGESANEIAEAVSTWEPRAKSMATQFPETFRSLLGNVGLRVHGNEG